MENKDLRGTYDGDRIMVLMGAMDAPAFSSFGGCARRTDISSCTMITAEGKALRKPKHH